MLMVLSMKENSLAEESMEMESLQILMELYLMKANGTVTDHRFKVQCNIQMEVTRVSL